MAGIVSQMEAAVQQLDDWDVTLRDIGSGLIDFPALANGRPIWLCWRLEDTGRLVARDQRGLRRAQAARRADLTPAP